MFLALLFVSYICYFQWGKQRILLMVSHFFEFKLESNPTNDLET